MILALALAQRIWKIDYAREAESLRSLGAARELPSMTIRITRAAACERTVGETVQAEGWDLVFGRLFREGHASLVEGNTCFRIGDLVTVVGSAPDLESAVRTLGEVSDRSIDLDRREVDYRRIFVSRSEVAGRKLRDLAIGRRFGAVVTRLRRGDVEFVPHGDTVLEPGDRVRVLGPRASMSAISAFFGDSYRALSEVDILAFSSAWGSACSSAWCPSRCPAV